MKRIKTPVQVNRSLLYDGIMDADGVEICGVTAYAPDYEYVTQEIRDAINAYDEHLARIAELEGQVEALVGALEPFAKLAEKVKRVPFARFGTVYEFDGVAITVPDLVRAIRALALVRGEASDV